MTSSPTPRDLELPIPDGPAIDPARDRLRAQLFGTPSSPTRVGRFVVLRELGAGGMGRVYAAYDEKLDRKVAVKVLHQDVASRPGNRQRLLREAQALARLSHPNVVVLYEVGEIDEQIFLAMELVTGQTLRQWQTATERTWRETLVLYLDAGRGLAAAHAAGLVHRDFKPDNVLVGDDGRVRVADFGLAFADNTASTLPIGTEVGALDATPPCEAISERITRTGARLGTPAYMALEQLRGQATDARTDQYSFCVSLFEALVGEHPYGGASATQLLTRMLAGRRRPVPRNRVPRGILAVLERGLSLEPGDRHPTMDSLLTALGRRLHRRRRGGALAVAGGLCGAGLLARGSTPPPCAAAGSEIGETWNESHADALHEAFVATGRSFAETTWQSTTQSLDAYARRWRDAQADACEATHVRQEQSSAALDLRGACLDQRRRELGALVDALAQADATAVDYAHEAVADLPGLDRCSDLDALRNRIAPPEAEDAAEVESIREGLAHARSALALGQLEASAQRLEPLVERARATAYGPLLAETLSTQGQVWGWQGRLEAAEGRLLESLDLAEAHHHDELAAHAWQHLGWLALDRLRDPVRGRGWLRRARAAMLRVGRPPGLEADLLQHEGLLYRVEQRLDEAEAAQREALDLRREHRGDTHAKVISSRVSLANLMATRGELQPARDEYVALIEQQQRTLGPEHPDVGRLRFNVARVELDLGLHEAAAKNLDAAVSIYGEVYGLDSSRLVEVLLLRSLVEDRRGQLAAALHWIGRARAIAEQSTDQQPTLASILTMTGTLEYRQGHWDRALESFQRALGLLEEQPEPSPFELAAARSNVGDALLELDRSAESLPYHQRALDSMRRALPPDHPHLAYPLRGIGQAHVLQGHPAQATDPLRTALSIFEANPGNPTDMATTKWWLARALASTDPTSALDLARQARATLSQQHQNALATTIDTWIADTEASP
ncbi:MAG: tetratricopeptide repeat protein [Myxococcota bacterium]